jgi:mannitol-specific phosphotransferase system IIBC component
MKKFKLSDKQKKAIKDYSLAVVAAAVTMGIALATDMAPQYAVVIGALAAPLAKWANKNSKDYGPGSKE